MGFLSLLDATEHACTRAMPHAAAPAWPFGSLQAGRYRVILADPPWSFRTYSPKGLAKSPQAHYACMSVPAIKALPVAALAHPEGAVLVMWGTAPMLPDALAVMSAWRFSYKSAGAWAKQSSTGRCWAFGPGYLYRSAAEFFLLGVVGVPQQTARDVRNLIVAPVREHSRKPDRLRADIERQWPGPRCELFAREGAPGWDVWGNETGKFDRC